MTLGTDSHVNGYAPSPMALTAAGPSALSSTEKLGLLQQFGSEPIAYTSIQPGMRDLVLDGGAGIASYLTAFGRHYVLGGPFCEESRLARCVAETVQALRRPTFFQVTRQIAEELKRSHRYRIASCGFETNIDLSSYSLENDTKKRNLRSFLRKGRAVARVLELTAAQRDHQFGITPERLDQFSNEWFAGKVKAEPIRFVVRPASWHDEFGVRKFYSFDARGELLGFVFFNPMFEGGRPIGYCADVMRAAARAPKGHVAFITLEALLRFQAEGHRTLSLGLSPFAPTDSTLVRNNRLLQFMLDRLFRHGRKLYNFQGIVENKRQYVGDERATYVCTGKNTVLEFFALSRCVGLL